MANCDIRQRTWTSDSGGIFFTDFQLLNRQLDNQNVPEQ